MPPYLKPIPVRTCARPGCTRRAVTELYNARNARLADYCATHGATALTTAEREHEATMAAATAMADRGTDA